MLAGWMTPCEMTPCHNLLWDNLLWKIKPYPVQPGGLNVVACSVYLQHRERETSSQACVCNFKMTGALLGQTLEWLLGRACYDPCKLV